MATLAQAPLTNSHLCAAPATPSWGTRLRRLLAAWTQRRHGWEAYGRMSDRDVQDTGVSRWDIERELARPFWHD